MFRAVKIIKARTRRDVTCLDIVLSDDHISRVSIVDQLLHCIRIDLMDSYSLLALLRQVICNSTSQQHCSVVAIKINGSNLWEAVKKSREAIASSSKPWQM